MTTLRVIAIADDRPVMRREQWGRKGKRRYFTATLETAATNNYWLRAWRENRIVLPVGGRHERAARREYECSSVPNNEDASVAIRVLALQLPRRRPYLK